MTERPCDECGILTEGRYLGKINGKRLCRKCRKSVRLNHREETFANEEEGERKIIQELSKKTTAEYQKSYRKKIRKETSDEPPKIKGGISQKKEKSQAYLSFEEKKILLGILVKRGMSFEDAKERLKSLTRSLKELREELKEKNISEEQIKNKQQMLIEELWNI